MHITLWACPSPPGSVGGLSTSSPDARYLEKHEERMAEEQKFLRESADEKYRRTHDYNIIAGTYYDQNKEENFVKSRERLGAMQGRAKQYRLPPSIRYGEGNDYNIISQQVCMHVGDGKDGEPAVCTNYHELHHAY